MQLQKQILLLQEKIEITRANLAKCEYIHPGVI